LAHSDFAIKAYPHRSISKNNETLKCAQAEARLIVGFNDTTGRACGKNADTTVPEGSSSRPVERATSPGFSLGLNGVPPTLRHPRRINKIHSRQNEENIDTLSCIFQGHQLVSR
jgi:hypothetical protein